MLNRPMATNNKIMKKTFFAVVLIFTTFLSFSQARVNRDLSAFDKVIVAGDIKLELTQCGKEDAAIVVKEASPDEVITEITGRTLKIKFNAYKFSKKGEATVFLNFNKIREISVEAGAEATLRTTLKADFFKAEVSGGGVFSGDVNVNALELRAVQGAVLKVNGKAASVEGTANTGGEIRGKELECEDAVIKANTGGTVSVAVTKSIDATAGTGGTVYYKGNPLKESTSSNLGGTITHER